LLQFIFIVDYFVSLEVFPYPFSLADPMPTPSNNDAVDARSLHSSCPPEDDRPSSWRTSETGGTRDADSVAAPIVEQRSLPPLSESPRSTDTSDANLHEQRMKDIGMAEESQVPSSETMSPASAEDVQEDSEQSDHTVLASGYTGGSSSMSNEFSNIRVCYHTSINDSKS
jgi:hypothetical protein